MKQVPIRTRYCVAFLAYLLAGTVAGHTQTSVDLRTQSKSVDFSAASATRPFKAGSVLPSTCSVGEAFFKSDAPAGKNLYGCVATDTWALLSGSGDVSSVFGRTGAVVSEAGDYTASQVNNTPAGNISATNVQAAINELDTEKAPVSHTHIEADIADLKHQHPVVTIANLPAPSAATNEIYVVTDAQQKTDCSVGGGATRVACISDGATWTPAAGDGGTGSGSPGGNTGDLQYNDGGAFAGIPLGIGLATNGMTSLSVDTATVPTYLTGTASLNFPSIANGACSTLTFTLAGAGTADAVAPGWPSGLDAGLLGMMRASATDTIEVRLCNFSGAAVDPANMTYRATIVRSF